MKRIICTLFFVFQFITNSFAQNEFKTTWRTTSGNESITIPTTGSGYNYDVDWGDGNTTTGHTGNATHTYVAAGDYQVSITGSFPRIYFNNSGDRTKIISIDQWGNQIWTSMERAFYGCSNLGGQANDSPDLSAVTNMNYMFAGASAFNQDIGSWNVGNITTMYSLFDGAGSFDKNISNWDVSNVADMSYMFDGAGSFNQNIGNWDVSNVSNMRYMFRNAGAFNQDISSWDVSKVTDMSYMFSNAVTFDRPLGSWIVSSVINMQNMFNGASSFNGDIGNWDVSNVTSMRNMFYNATSFNQDIGNWDVGNVTNMSHMFNGASSFNQDISNWNVVKVTDMSYIFFNAVNFDQPAGNWDVGNVTNMSYMFAWAGSFNQDIRSWNVGSVNNMRDMFYNATAFNQDISGWNTGNITNMQEMFYYANSFNQDISSWSVNNVTNMKKMFYSASAFNQNLGTWSLNGSPDLSDMLSYSGLDVTNYDNTLIGWESQGVSNLTLGATNLNYCNSDNERTSLINTYGWTISGDNYDCTALPLDYIDFNIEAIDNKYVKISAMLETHQGIDKVLIGRSQDGLRWKEIFELSATGSDSGLFEFDELDKEPFNGDNYYRLKVFDYDGHSKVYGAQMIRIRMAEKYDIFPNPALYELNIMGAGNTNVKILNSLGRILDEYKQLEDIKIDISNYPAGIYFIHICSGANIYSAYIIKE